MTSKRAVIVALAITLALTASLAAVAAREQVKTPPAVAALDPSAAALLTAELGKIPSSSLRSASLIVPPAAAQALSGTRPGSWLQLEATATDGGSAAVAAWYAALVASAYAVDAPAHGVETLVGETTEVRDPAGKVLYVDTGLVPASSPRTLPSIPDQAVREEAVRAHIAAGAARAGLQIQSIEFYNAPRLTVAVTAQTDDAKAFVADSGHLLNEIQADDQYDSRLIEVVDTSGERIFVSTWDNRFQRGTAWARPGLGDDWHH